MLVAEKKIGFEWPEEFIEAWNAFVNRKGLVSKAVGEMDRNEFSTTEIVGRIKQTNSHLNGEINNSSIAKILSRLVGEKLIDVKQEGAGRRPTIFSLS